MNAIYFKDDWLFKFDEELTEKRIFYIYEEQAVQTDFMYIYVRYVRLDDLDAKVIELEYANTDIIMLIILPNSRTSLATLEAQMKSYEFRKLTTLNDFKDVYVRIPKLKIDFEIDLNNVLKNVSYLTVFHEII